MTFYPCFYVHIMYEAFCMKGAIQRLLLLDMLTHAVIKHRERIIDVDFIESVPVKF